MKILMTLWPAVAMGSVMSALFTGYLVVTRRLPGQPFRKWDMHLGCVFYLLTAYLINWSLCVLGITEIHQRRAFFATAMGLFAFSGFVAALMMSPRDLDLRKEPWPDSAGGLRNSSPRREPGRDGPSSGTADSERRFPPMR